MSTTDDIEQAKAVIGRWRIDGLGAYRLLQTDAGYELIELPDGDALGTWGADDTASMLAYVTKMDRAARALPPKEVADAGPGIILSSQINPPRRGRPLDPAVGSRRQALLGIIKSMRPMTVRQVFYAATVRDLVEKTENGYAKVQTDLTLMRRSGDLPYGWLTDSTRYQRKPRSYESMDEALRETARFYRRDLWADAGSYVEVWIEKDALSGVVYPVTAEYDVPLMSARGYASLTFLHGAAEYIATLDVPTYIYQLGDHDPSGVNAGEKIEQTLRELAPEADIHFERVAVTSEQIRKWNLPSRPTKQSDPRAKGFTGESVELDAIEPDQLRALVRECIERHVNQDALDILLVAEASEREILTGLAGTRA